MSNYQDFYNKLTKDFRGNTKAVKLINSLNNSITKLIYLLYPVLLVVLGMTSYQSTQSMQTTLWKTLPYLVIPAISFMTLSVIRKHLNYPRPYEKWPIETLIQKDTVGNSMPSRHVFSATIIAMCVLHVNLWLGGILLLLAIGLAVLRVLGGVHYPQDVVLGFLVGILSGALLWLF